MNVLLLCLLGNLLAQQESSLEEELDRRQRHFEEHARRAVPRDTFDVFTEPEMVDAKEAERLGLVRDSEFVIGVHHDGEAKAYPISVMGTAELGNDVIAGVPIAVSW